MVEMCWNVNQPGRWRRPALVAQCFEKDTDWKRFLLNRPYEEWDPRKYLEYRLFWPYSSGIPGQWMSHQIDTYIGLRVATTRIVLLPMAEYINGMTDAAVMTR